MRLQDVLGLSAQSKATDIALQDSCQQQGCGNLLQTQTLPLTLLCPVLQPLTLGHTPQITSIKCPQKKWHSLTCNMSIPRSNLMRLLQ